MRLSSPPDLSLIPPEMADAEAIYALVDANRDYLARWLSWATISTLDSIRGWINGAQAQQEHERGVQWLIRRSGRIVGVVGIVECNVETASAEIGYWLAADESGSGVMTRATAVVIDYLISAQATQRIVIRVAVGNARSRAIPLRLGFTLEGIHRRDLRINGVLHDVACYALLSEDWKSSLP